MLTLLDKFITFTALRPYTVILAVLAICGILVFPVFTTVGGWLGFDTKESLRQELNQEKANTAVLTEVNASNVKATEIAKADVVITTEVLDNNIESKKVIEKKATIIKKHVEAEIAVIEASTITDEDKVTAKSKARAVSIWQTYCSFNEDPECSAVPMPFKDTTVSHQEEDDVAQT